MFEWVFALMTSLLICDSDSFSFKITVADEEIASHHASFAYQTLEAPCPTRSTSYAHPSTPGARSRAQSTVGQSSTSNAGPRELEPGMT